MHLLILLIGGNNIANYALVKYFKEFSGKIPLFNRVVLVHTEQTRKDAVAFEILQPSVEFILVNLEEYNRNLSEIKSRIVKVLNSFVSVNSIHLNYTGGTKSMSLGAYIAVEEYIKGLTVETFYSDISFNDYKLFLKKGDMYPEKGSIQDSIQVDLKEFFILHHLQSPVFKVEHSEFYQKEWVPFLIDKIENDQETFFDNLWDKKEIKYLSWQESIKGMVDTNTVSNNKLLKLQKFIKGNWLEEYLFDVLNELKEEKKIDFVYWNVENTSQKDAKFEVDVVLIKGYQLYVFSCTTTTNQKHILKSKAFEALKRAEDMGGIRAIPVFVSMATDTVLQKIAENDMRTFQGRSEIKLIGIEELKEKARLIKRLKEIIA